MVNGWIKLHRCIIDKPIWSCATVEQKVIFITVLMLANHKENQWEWKGKKYICQPGQFITSLPSLAEKSGCSIQNIRTALKRFKNYEFLTDEPTATGRLITVVNWAKYQSKDDDLTGELTDSQQTPNRRLTPNKNDKNDKEKYTTEQLEEIREVVEYLNEVTGKDYKWNSDSTMSMVGARFKEYKDIDLLIEVIDKKVAEWKNDKKMSKFLRPSTLFNKTNFENYLNE